MALPAIIRSQAWLSALGMLRADPDGADLGTITREIRNKYDGDRVYTTIDFLNVARSAQRAAQAGDELTDARTVATPGASLPAVPSTALNPDRFEYRVVVVIEPADGGDEVRTAITVTSSRSLSHADVVSQAEEAVRENETDSRDTLGPDKVKPADHVSVIILTAGRVT